jgi:hypothetical protein
MPNFCPSCGTKLGGAAFCPNCGTAFAQPAKKPQRKVRRAFLFLLFCVAALIIVAGFIGSSGSSSSSTSNPGSASSATGNDQTPAATQTATPPPAAPTEADLKDADYLDQHYDIQASTACESWADDYLRQVAKYDFAWDKTGFLESKFDSYSRIVKSPGVLTLITKKAKLQNGFGAFQHVTLVCDYDTQRPYQKDDVTYSVMPPSDEPPPDESPSDDQ